MRDQLRPRPGGQADAVPDQAVLGGRRRAELRHRRVERRVDLQGQASQAHARSVVGRQPGHVAEVLVRRRRELEEREPLGVGHLQFGGRHGEILVLGLRCGWPRCRPRAGNRRSADRCPIASAAPAVAAPAPARPPARAGAWPAVRARCPSPSGRGASRHRRRPAWPSGFHSGRVPWPRSWQGPGLCNRPFGGPPDWPRPAPLRPPAPGDRSAVRRSSRRGWSIRTNALPGDRRSARPDSPTGPSRPSCR